MLGSLSTIKSPGQVIVGAILSSTVTVVVQVEVFPFTSVTVSVTVLSPISAHENVSGETESVAIPQASVEPPSTSAPVIVTVPFASSCAVKGWQVAVGATLSSTVTVAVQVELFPFTSVTVKVTVLAPISAQVKDAGETLNEVIPQLSVEPLSISDAVIITFPVASSCKVIF